MKKWVLDFNWSFYDTILKAHESWRLQKTVIVPPVDGRAFEVRAKQVLRIGLPEGPQVCDLNAFAAENPREHFWSGRTRILEGTHLTIMNRLWSLKVRPMFTLIADTVPQPSTHEGGRSHDLLYARCSLEHYELVRRQNNAPNCQENLARAIEPFGLTPDYVHDAFNIFMKTGIDSQDHRLFIEASDSRKGDYVELYTEMDMIVAVSACPGGDGTERHRTYPLKCDIYAVPDINLD